MKMNKNQFKQTAKRWIALIMAILLIGGAVFSSVISMIHVH